MTWDLGWPLPSLVRMGYLTTSGLSWYEFEETNVNNGRTDTYKETRTSRNENQQSFFQYQFNHVQSGGYKEGSGSRNRSTKTLIERKDQKSNSPRGSNNLEVTVEPGAIATLTWQ